MPCLHRQGYVVIDHGKRFLIDTFVEAPASPLTVLLNWKGKPPETRK